ncbi:ATP synthase F1 subunit delta [Pontibacter sp. G13]|uniref:ATP synthase F1 subunit delta n=1 Tax=Pontibacter sp. G13 TaxID=3074898 RepID=UPI00288B252A|nr:ATP synthase F1 subunit delta [Pontibacter sp. G13]WNJ21391.1 ATP synthase F1 subunit delta [Pontibacter sp. G13]
MVEDRIGYRYAKSLFGLATEKGQLDAVQQDMTFFREVFQENPELVRALQSPVISSEKKEAVLNAVFKGKTQSELSIDMIDMIVEKQREHVMPHIAHAFHELYDSAKGVVRGTLISAQPLEDAIKTDIVKTLEGNLGKTVVLTDETNPDLIGGFVLKVGDRQYDGSISTYLRRLKQDFAGNFAVSASE